VTWRPEIMDWVVEKLLAVVHWVPALFLEEGSPNHDLIRVMFALLLLVLVLPRQNEERSWIPSSRHQDLVTAQENKPFCVAGSDMNCLKDSVKKASNRGKSLKYIHHL